MGQKESATANRLNTTAQFASKWYSKDSYSEYVYQDELIRDIIVSEYGNSAQISKIVIERPKNIKVIIFAAKPFNIIGPKGAKINSLKEKLNNKILGASINITVEEVKKPELDATLVANTIASQIERRVTHRRAMKKAIQAATKQGAQGVKIIVSGCLGGAEIARSEKYLEGRVPLHTFRADIDYALGRAYTTYGVIGIKVWIFRGEVINHRELRRGREG